MWVLLAIEGLLLLALLIGDPGAIDRRSRLLRGLSIGLVCALVVSALWATTALISDLIGGGPETNSAGDLLRAGAAVWVSNNIAFALLYWGTGQRRRGRTGASNAPGSTSHFRKTSTPGSYRPTGDLVSSTTSTWASPTPPRSAPLT